MGYELYIQRPEGAECISVDEWLRLVDADPEFTAIDRFSSDLPDGGYIEAMIPQSAAWNALEENIPFMFSHETSAIIVKNPNEEIIKEMIVVAEKLNAVVTGDDGEIYDRENPLGYFSDPEIFEENNAVKARWWEFWK
ncbi:MAG: hypothetical protein HKN25_17190 [Pyrinomonadaceae bacterium]|nr:hypothetical protein [Pyrinomonadaceae bacterium]